MKTLKHKIDSPVDPCAVSSFEIVDEGITFMRLSIIMGITIRSSVRKFKSLYESVTTISDFQFCG